MRYSLYNEPTGPVSTGRPAVIAEADTLSPLLIVMSKIASDLILNGAFFELVIYDTKDSTVYFRVRGNN